MIKLNGQSIVETVVAAGLISVAVIAALSLATRSELQSTYAKNSTEATKYASQAGDWIRSQRNRLGWATITASSAGIYCLNILPTDFYSLPSPGECNPEDYIPDTRFQRHLILDNSLVASGTVKISIKVSWQEKTIRQSTLELELTQWN
ncbi:MAG: hypothetical protein V1487_03990 [bacterium]